MPARRVQLRVDRDAATVLADRSKPGMPAHLTGSAQDRTLASARTPPLSRTVPAHWSSEDTARHREPHEGTAVMRKVVVQLWRQDGP